MRFATEIGTVQAVGGISFALGRRETLGVVGESGAGKSVMARAIMGLLPAKGVQLSGRVELGGSDILRLKPGLLQKIRGRDIGFVPPQPTASLNPVMTVGDQIAESLRVHMGMSKRAARDEALALLVSVRIPSPRSRLDDYPHQLSGGMCQRVAIAIAISCRPKVLIADEATTALDVTVQARVLELLSELQQQHHMAMILITHDLRLATSHTDRTAVMYGGRFVEIAPSAILFASPRMPYTEGLRRATPTLDGPTRPRLRPIPGQPPIVLDDSGGCTFMPRCERAGARCGQERPSLTGAADHSYACWYPLDLTANGERREF